LSKIVCKRLAWGGAGSPLCNALLCFICAEEVGVTERGDHIERAIGFVKAMLALHDERVVVNHMPMQNDLLVCREFEQYMHIMALFIDAQYSKKQVF
jgi:hypothetical protein